MKLDEMVRIYYRDEHDTEKLMSLIRFADTCSLLSQQSEVPSQESGIKIDQGL